MLVEIEKLVSAKAREDYSGVVDIAKIILFKGVFAPLKDKSYFSRVTLNSDIGTICWENGADISPSVLFENIQKNAA